MDWVYAVENSDIILLDQLLTITDCKIPHIPIREFLYEGQMLSVESLISIVSANHNGQIVDLLVATYGSEYGLSDGLRQEDSLLYAFHDSGPFDHLNILTKYGKDYYVYALKLAIRKGIHTSHDLENVVYTIFEIPDKFRFIPLLDIIFSPELRSLDVDPRLRIQYHDCLQEIMSVTA